MIPGKGKITSAVGDFGKNTLEAAKEEIKRVGEEMEDQLGVSPQVKDGEDQDEGNLEEEVLNEKKIEAKERQRIKRIEEELAIARRQIEEERKKIEEARANQPLERKPEKGPVVQGLPDPSGVEEPLPSLDETPLPPSKPRRGFFPQGAEKFKKKE